VVRLAEPAVVPPRGELLANYRHHLLHDRGLTPGTVLRYERFAKRFLSQRASRIGGQTGAEDLTMTEVNAYLLAASSRLVPEPVR
jgi:hypothetical protein